MDKLNQQTEKLAIANGSNLSPPQQQPPAQQQQQQQPQPPQKERKPKEIRLSTLSESQIMEKLRSVVSKGDPTTIYAKIKKVGQGYILSFHSSK